MSGEVVAALTNWQAVAVIVAMLVSHAAWQWMGDATGDGGDSLTDAAWWARVARTRTQHDDLLPQRGSTQGKDGPSSTDAIVLMRMDAGARWCESMRLAERILRLSQLQ